MDSILKNIHEFMINAVFFITALVVRTLGNHLSWFDSSMDIILALIGITSGILTIRWLIVRTQCTRDQSKLEIEQRELEIDKLKIELENLNRK